MTDPMLLLSVFLAIFVGLLYLSIYGIAVLLALSCFLRRFGPL